MTGYLSTLLSVSSRSLGSTPTWTQSFSASFPAILDAERTNSGSGYDSNVCHARRLADSAGGGDVTDFNTPRRNDCPMCKE